MEEFRPVLAAWQKRKQEEVQHPFLNEPAPVGLFPHLQALLLARHEKGAGDQGVRDPGEREGGLRASGKRGVRV